jgi:DNA-binding response OmpR family regulator/HPt (histidine-containing phosphotransfer) domain-containing protein
MNDPASRQTFAGRSALLIDDSAYMRRLVRSLLRQFGFEVVDEASDGSQALRQIADRIYDVVVCDWMMEPVDGYAFVRSLRQHDIATVRSVPVVMLTAVARYDKVAAARDVGITEYLVKPVSAGKLKARLVAALTRPRPFVVSDSYIGPDRRRRADFGYQGMRRRFSDALQDQDVEPDAEWLKAARDYPSVLRGEIGRLRAALVDLRGEPAAALEPWRLVHRIAHDLKGQAPTFGHVAAAEIAGSLERLVRPGVQAPETLELCVARRLRAAETHVEALALVLDQGITGCSSETDALAERLNRAVERVHRESLGGG